MQPHELIRRAAKIIETSGWATGVMSDKDGKETPIAARDASGEPVTLFDATTGGESRTRVNRKAVSFSAYGALVKAQEAHGEPPHLGLMWATLMVMAQELGNVPSGGTNYVHPVIQFNLTEGRTKEEVLAFLEQAAAAVEAKLNPPAPPAEAVAS
jgi:hypothetical protein